MGTGVWGAAFWAHGPERHHCCASATSSFVVAPCTVRLRLLGIRSGPRTSPHYVRAHSFDPTVLRGGAVVAPPK